MKEDYEKSLDEVYERCLEIANKNPEKRKELFESWLYIMENTVDKNEFRYMKKSDLREHRGLMHRIMDKGKEIVGEMVRQVDGITSFGESRREDDRKDT